MNKIMLVHYFLQKKGGEVPK